MTQINNPIGTVNHVEVVLDYEDGIALIHQPLHHIHQLVHLEQHNPVVLDPCHLHQTLLASHGPSSSRVGQTEDNICLGCR